MIVRTALASALALGALTSAALAEEPAKELLQLTDAQMDGVTAGQPLLTNLAAIVAFAAGGTGQIGGNSVTSNNSISQSNTIDVSTSSGGG
jgi:hypothetical protein